MSNKAPSKRTIRRELRKLRALIENTATDPVAMHVAWSVEQAVRWSTEATSGWPALVDDAHDTANLIRHALSEQLTRPDRDVEALKACCIALESCSCREMVKATLDFLNSKYGEQLKR